MQPGTYCTNCGAELRGRSRFCTNCGAEREKPPVTPTRSAPVDAAATAILGSKNPPAGNEVTLPPAAPEPPGVLEATPTPPVDSSATLVIRPEAAPPASPSSPPELPVNPSPQPVQRPPRRRGPLSWLRSLLRGSR